MSRISKSICRYMLSFVSFYGVNVWFAYWLWWSDFDSETVSAFPFLMVLFVTPVMMSISVLAIPHELSTYEGDVFKFNLICAVWQGGDGYDVDGYSVFRRTPFKIPRYGKKSVEKNITCHGCNKVVNVAIAGTRDLIKIRASFAALHYTLILLVFVSRCVCAFHWRGEELAKIFISAGVLFPVSAVMCYFAPFKEFTGRPTIDKQWSSTKKAWPGLNVKCQHWLEWR